MVMLGIRTALKEDIGCSVAELVYGTTLCIPGEFYSSPSTTTADDPISYVTQLKSVMQKLQAVPPRLQGRKSYISKALSSCSHVFVRHDAVRAPLQQPYDGPFKVLKRDSKHFLLDIKGRKETISLDRLKPAHLDSLVDSNTSPAVTVSPPPPRVPLRSQSVAPPNTCASEPPTRVTRSGRHVRFPDRLNL